MRPGRRPRGAPSPHGSGARLDASRGRGVGIVARVLLRVAGARVRLRDAGPRVLLRDAGARVRLRRDGAVAGARRVEVRGTCGRIPGLETGSPGLLALLGGAVMARVGGVEVADREGRVERLLHVAVLEAVLLRGAVRPRAGVAVGLELERHGRNVLPVLVEEAEFLLDLMAVFVRDDVGDREVAGRPAVALRAAGERLVERAVVDVGGELLGDVQRVVAGAVRRRAVAQ